MLIGELAKQANVSKDALRLYTKMGLLKPAERQAGLSTYADYPNDAVELVKNIKLSQAAGFTLAEIKLLAVEYFAGTMTPTRQREILEDKLRQIREKQKALETLARSVQKKIDLTVDHTP
jgi:MerR family copper efflux transcriptional regulator